MAISIRPVQETDAEFVAQLSGELGYPCESPVMRHRIARLLAAQDRTALVACDGDVVAGWIEIALTQHLQSVLTAEISGLVVRSDFRNGGLGSKLLDAAEHWAARMGAERMLVRSQVSREAAHRFYLREGYAQTKTSAVFTKSL